MTVTTTNIKDLVPGAANRTDPELQGFIDAAASLVSPDYFGTRVDMAVSYLAAHFASITQPTADSGTSFPWSPNLDDSNLSRTSYGQMFLLLRNSSSVGAGGKVWDP